MLYNAGIQTHANPCFLRVGEDKDVTVLPRDQPFELQDGHVIGFLPDSLYFRVICDKPRCFKYIL